MAILLGVLAFGSAHGQESGVFYQPIAPAGTKTPEKRAAKTLQLKGVLISELTRAALVDNQRVEEGDRIGGAEILAIDQSGILVLMGTTRMSIDVGGSFVADGVRSDTIHVSRPDERRKHEVRFGETLSGIALRHLKDGVSLNQMMVALYASNPQAFGNNINTLHEGAVLHIPTHDDLHRQTPEAATVLVAQQTDRWRSVDEPTAMVAKPSSAREYGPVEGGETLSAIAARVMQADVTMNQMMVALYERNPHAFNDNINLLREGAVLRIPDDNEVRRQTPETATAEVVRQTREWQAGDEPQEVLTLAQSNPGPPVLACFISRYARHAPWAGSYCRSPGA